MSNCLKSTFELLARTPGRASVELLAAGLDSPHPAIRNAAVRAVLASAEADAAAALLGRLPALDEEARTVLGEQPQRLGRLVGGVIRSRRADLYPAACRAMVELQLYSEIPALVELLDSDRPKDVGLAAQTMLRLSELFYEKLCAAASATERRDMLGLRDWITSKLEEGVRRYARHRRLEPIEAFLQVARRQNELLRGILKQASSSMCGTVVERLSVSPRGGVIRLVLSFLEDANLPAVVLQVLAGRDDAKFVEHLVRQTGPEPSPAVAGIFRQVDRIGWARPGHPVWAALDSDGQYNAVRLIAVSSVPREELLAVLADVQATGQPGGRRAAARTLADLKGPAADHLAVRGLKDDDPEVLAHLIPQIRPRGLPDADDLLTALADHPDPRVHAALREALPEFDLRHFLANFDALSTGTRRAQGRVVARIGVNVTGQLAEEIRSFTPERRRRAALAAGVMGVAPQLEENVIHLLADQDQVVRAAAAEALADCPTRAAYEALHTALADRSSMVRAAAERGLARFRDLLDQQAASGASLEEASP